MAQVNKIQDGTVVYSSTDPASVDLAFNIQGNALITKSLLVSSANATDGTIASSTGTDLLLTVSPGLAANVKLQTPVAGGSIILNNVSWIPSTNTPNTGGFIGASAVNTLKYYPFVAGTEVSDVLTTSYLNTNYPTITPGQMVIGSTVVYLCVGSGLWRPLSNGAGGGTTAGVSSINGATGAVTLKTVNGTQLVGTGDIIISGGSGGTPGGATTQLQYNSAGVFAGSSSLTWDNTNAKLSIGGSSNPGNISSDTSQLLTITGGIGLTLTSATGNITIAKPLSVNGSTGVNGQYLKTTGPSSVPQWATTTTTAIAGTVNSTDVNNPFLPVTVTVNGIAAVVKILLTQMTDTSGTVLGYLIHA